MKKEEIPQDRGALGKLTGEIIYAVDESGKYNAAADLEKKAFQDLSKIKWPA
jgi:hypothetical protein